MRPPVTSDPLTILLGHNHWATRRVLDLCRGLSPAQLQRRFDIGPGSLHDTLVHVVDCMRWWADDVRGRPRRPSLAPPGHAFSVDDVSRLFDEAHAEFEALVEESDGRLGDFVHTTFGGDKQFTFT